MSVSEPLSKRPLVEILLVEDNPSDVILTQIALRQCKIANNLQVAADGEAALQLLRGQGEFADSPRPDLILLDLNLPRMDGRELLAAIKDDENLRTIPVVVLTTSEAERDVLQSYSLHANAYITKPIDMDQFVRIVRAIDEFWFDIVRLPARRTDWQSLRPAALRGGRVPSSGRGPLRALRALGTRYSRWHPRRRRRGARLDAPPRRYPLPSLRSATLDFNPPISRFNQPMATRVPGSVCPLPGRREKGKGEGSPGCRRYPVDEVMPMGGVMLRSMKLSMRCWTLISTSVNFTPMPRRSRELMETIWPLTVRAALSSGRVKRSFTLLPMGSGIV